jgi:hypothetical protein
MGWAGRERWAGWGRVMGWGRKEAMVGGGEEWRMVSMKAVKGQTRTGCEDNGTHVGTNTHTHTHSDPHVGRRACHLAARERARGVCESAPHRLKPMRVWNRVERGEDRPFSGLPGAVARCMVSTLMN